MFSMFTRGALVLGGVATLLISSVSFASAQSVTDAAHKRAVIHLGRDELAVAAKTIGLADVKALRGELRGTTLTAVAQKHNVAPGAVEAAMKADVDAKIQALVTNGKVKAERAAKLKTKAEGKIDTLMTHEFRAKP
jgi:hypothetical protein